MMSQHLDSHLECKDIDVSHRLGKYFPNKNRPVIVKFVRRRKKIDVMKRAKLLKGSGIYIIEDLTKKNAEVIASLRLKETGCVERAWSYEGKLFVRYRVSERNEQIHFNHYQSWLSKPWQSKNRPHTLRKYRLLLQAADHQNISNKNFVKLVFPPKAAAVL
ncbi:hypothetical protein DPMN_021685 [Dreissena polymorpha]|uniref:Uncharacterized protein n=1 Tax=Dreissena polymorpha TaxID=45954 RepID=A0A9D4SBY9_DREPO|nr:hypothetical protein DPMN_021685 [Dreissena polymorpha]